MVAQFSSPSSFEFHSHSRVINLLIAGIDVRECSHITGTLDVVLAPKRAEACAFSANIAGQ